jgi:hypothetical protein
MALFLVSPIQNTTPIVLSERAFIREIEGTELTAVAVLEALFVVPVAAPLQLQCHPSP